MGESLVSGAEILAARSRIAAHVHHTPIHGSSSLSAHLGKNVHFKAELFQRTGSFKIRGVLNCLAGLDRETLSRGLVSMSAGNHAAALACGAATYGAPATIVMPGRAVQSKIDATERYGGRVVRTDGDLMEEVDRLQREEGLTLVHPFDDARIVAGHGTIGFEILEDLPEVTHVIVPVGGGGLISGIAAAIRSRRPEVKLYGVEPENADGMGQALAAGKPISIGHPQTLADGLAAPFAGELNLRHVQRLVDDVVTVRDETILEAMDWIVTRCKLACEPSGAAALAALLEDKIKLPPTAQVCCIVSGGNVDLSRLGTR
ncbi:MAG: threonine/serine dehydratase [Acidobacteriota bacterium]|nr:threonine/serine dehydratase [Acidobacteriota bacterium]MDH3785504.1 threonine/serine dehydratase [Acidobacteriota bacterium]